MSTVSLLTDEQLTLVHMPPLVAVVSSEGTRLPDLSDPRVRDPHAVRVRGMPVEIAGCRTYAPTWARILGKAEP